MYFRNGKMYRRVLFSSCVVFFILFCGLVFATEPASDLLISPTVLEPVGLSVNWQINLPLKDDEKIDRMFVFDSYLYVLTDQNYFFCIHRERGTYRFTVDLASAGLPICSPLYEDKLLFFVIGKELVILDAVSGTVKERKKFDNIGKGATCMIGRNLRHIFIAGTDKRIHAIVADGYWQEFMVTADNDTLINSLLADDRAIVFSTVVGNVVGIKADSREKLWQIDLSDGIVAPIVRDGAWVYIGCKDTKLYKHHFNAGISGWPIPFHAGAKLTEPVVAGKKVLYQYAGHKGVYGIDKETGKKLWQVSDGKSMLAEKDNMAYVLTEPGVLVIQDNKTGKCLSSVDFAGVSKYAANTTDDTIYVADNKGRLVSID